MAITIYDISKKAGVSIATVSRVLNGNTNVKPETRNRVLQIIEKYNYMPSGVARGMGSGSMKTIGLLCADSSDPFLAKAVFYLEQELQANGYESLLCCTGYNLDSRKNYLRLLLSKKVDSIILVGSNFIAGTKEENQYIMDASAHVPVMLLNAAFDYPNVYSTLCDDYTSTYEATMALIRSGVNDPIYLFDSYSYSGKKKLSGFQAALADSHFPVKGRSFLYEGNLEQIHEIQDFVRGITEKGVSFHGVIASNDNLAIGAVKYAQQAGVPVPDELSVIGYNNSILSGCCIPELTSIDNCLETQTHQLIQTLLGLLEGHQMPTKIIFPGRLVKRETTRF